MEHEAHMGIRRGADHNSIDVIAFDERDRIL
jgi:hypothetical protein